MIDKLATYDKGAAAALEHFDNFNALRYRFPIGPRSVTLTKQRDGKRARGTWDKQVYYAAKIETVIERIREEIR